MIRWTQAELLRRRAVDLDLLQRVIISCTQMLDSPRAGVRSCAARVIDGADELTAVRYKRSAEMRQQVCDLPASPHTRPRLLVSPHTSPHLPTSPPMSTANVLSVASPPPRCRLAGNDSHCVAPDLGARCGPLLRCPPPRDDLALAQLHAVHADDHVCPKRRTLATTL